MRIVTLLLFLLVPISAFAQQGPPQLSPDVQQLVNQIRATGCQAEEVASAQTIDQLRKENADLKTKLQKLDPPPKPKSGGATAH